MSTLQSYRTRKSTGTHESMRSESTSPWGASPRVQKLGLIPSLTHTVSLRIQCMNLVESVVIKLSVSLKFPAFILNFCIWPHKTIEHYTEHIISREITLWHFDKANWKPSSCIAHWTGQMLRLSLTLYPISCEIRWPFLIKNATG